MKPDIDAIRERAEKATPGPWKVVEKGNTVKSVAVTTFAVAWNPQEMICPNMSPKTGNADFIANARTDINALLAYIAELEQERDAAVMDMSVACIAGESCAVCANCRDRGDQFPCAISDKWCCGQGWKWRGVKK